MVKAWEISASHLFVIKPDNEGIYMISKNGSYAPIIDADSWKGSIVLAKYDCKIGK